jgi:hypothetical protein
MLLGCYISESVIEAFVQDVIGAVILVSLVLRLFFRMLLGLLVSLLLRLLFRMLLGLLY